MARRHGGLERRHDVAPQDHVVRHARDVAPRRVRQRRAGGAEEPRVRVVVELVRLAAEGVVVRRAARPARVGGGRVDERHVARPDDVRVGDEHVGALAALAAAAAAAGSRARRVPRGAGDRPPAVELQELLQVPAHGVLVAAPVGGAPAGRAERGAHAGVVKREVRGLVEPARDRPDAVRRRDRRVDARRAPRHDPDLGHVGAVARERREAQRQHARVLRRRRRHARAEPRHAGAAAEARRVGRRAHVPGARGTREQRGRPQGARHGPSNRSSHCCCAAQLEFTPALSK